MKSRFFRILLSILILSFALQTFTDSALAHQEIENLGSHYIDLNEDSIPDETRLDGIQTEPDWYYQDVWTEAPIEDDGSFEDLEVETPSPEMIAETNRLVEDFSCSSITDVPISECEALVDFFVDANFRKGSWLKGTTVGTWDGVTVEDGHVTRLKFGAERQDAGFYGIISPSIGDLPYLKSFYIRNSKNLSGSIPSEIGNLTNLTSLTLMHSSGLGGPIPSTIGNLINLESFDFNMVSLTGDIPDELGNLVNLKSIQIDYTKLTGNLPATIGNLKKVTSLWIFKNSLLSGTIPPQIGNMTNLTNLKLYENKLTGYIPPEMGNLKNLSNLELYSNQLTGELPSELGQMNNIYGIYLHNNLLSGNIPPELGDLPRLSILNLSNNNLIGEIPLELGKLKTLTYLYLNNNNLTGNIPAELGGLTRLYTLSLSNNKLSGPLPSELANLSSVNTLYLHNNANISGSIPLSFVQLKRLEWFNCSGTNLCEPTTPEFIAWKRKVRNWTGSGIICEETPTEASWLLMYYFALDNNLEKTRNGELKQVMAYRQSNIDIAIMLDKPGDITEFLFSQQGGTFETFSFPDLNSGDGKTLTDFMVWAKSKSKAPSQALIIIDHGNGLAGIAWDDSESKDYIKVNGELRTAILEAGAVDVIFASACLTGNMEFMWELRGLTDYYVGSESITYGTSHHYLRIVDQFTSPLELAILMAKELKGSFTAFPSTISVIDMNHISDIFEATNKLALAIYLAPIPVQDSLWNVLKHKVQRFDGEDIDMFNTYADEIADLFHFAELVKDFDGLSMSANNLLALKDDFVVYNKTQNFFYIYYKNAKGVSIHLPVNPASFYDGEWLDFGTGADWTFTGNGKKSTPQVEGYYWGPMISEMVRLYNPEGPDNPNPPDLFAPPPNYEIYLPLTTK